MNTLSQHSLPLLGEKTGATSFGNDDLNLMSPAPIDQFLTSASRYFGSLFLIETASTQLTSDYDTFQMDSGQDSDFTIPKSSFIYPLKRGNYLRSSHTFLLRK